VFIPDREGQKLLVNGEGTFTGNIWRKLEPPLVLLTSIWQNSASAQKTPTFAIDVVGDINANLDSKRVGGVTVCTASGCISKVVQLPEQTALNSLTGA